MKKVSSGMVWIAGLSLLIQTAHAELPHVGTLLPAVTVQRGGEVILNAEEMTRQPWQPSWPQSRPQLIIHVAGRLAAKQQLNSVVTRLEQAQWVTKSVTMTTIVNTDDSIWGSQPFVEHSILNSKKHSPTSRFILDSSGVVAHQWQLQPESAAIVATTGQGQVIFFQQAPFSAADIQRLLDRLQYALKSGLNSSFH
ncbi:YtfJ family protein [Rosenbergiella sp. S61]|uniref:YtfJ family protein n=1 Tax=Rosenbergiella gaditana TaxID=2726987 RepID=A0ABS5SXS7_9GAMM|nr:YtfJ family protein [Rosenbergiella gaditana]MBT0724912.1 YtfJ family protein [Rosenbergiella gaditana]